MSVNYNQNLKYTMQKLMKDLPSNQLQEVIDFIEFLKNKNEKIEKLQEKRKSLKGLISNTSVTDTDIEEAKNIWKLP